MVIVPKKSLPWSERQILSRLKSQVSLVRYYEKQRKLGIEVKASESIRADDFKHLKWFSAQVDDFVGLVLYAGNGILSFGSRLYAVPFSALWAR